MTVNQSALTAEGTARTVRVAGGELNYHEAGEGHPLIFLHGSGPGATGWSNFAPNIAVLSRHFRCLAVDMPGWGGSYPVKAADRNHAEVALQFMDALGLEKAAFVGNSMGGATTIRFAITHPDRMSHMITMGAGAGGRKMFGPGDGPSEGLKILYRGYRDPSIETMRELVDIMSYDSGDAREELARARSENALAHQEHLDNFVAGMGSNRDWPTERELLAIPVPSLIVHGRDDRVVHFENSLRLVTMVPDSRLVLFNRCGHWAQLEHADEFNRLVEQFVRHH
jgi:2-hydroxy-6-oxonona-2,4-dienedioate hydrolase